MNVDGHTACLASATVVIEIPKSGHTMTIQMTDRGDGQIYGAVVAEHKLPKGVLCKHCDTHLVSLHTQFEGLIHDAILEHLKHCRVKPRKHSLRIIA